MTQDPFSEAWDSGGTATADPFAAAWDAEPAPTYGLPRGVTQPGLPPAGPGGPDPNYVQGLRDKARPNLARDNLVEGARSFANAPVQIARDVVGASGALTAGAGRKLGSHALETIGEGERVLADEIPQIPHVPGQEGGLADKLGGGLGFIATAAVPGLAGAKGVAALAPAAVMGAASNGYALHQEVLAKTHDPDKAMAALLTGGAVGAGMSVLPVHRVLARLNGASGGALVRAIGDVGTGVFVGAGQSTLNDVIQEHATGEDLAILQRAVDAGELGGLTMLLAGGIAGAKSHTDSAGKPHAAAAEPVQGEQTRVPVEETGKAGEVVTAPPEGVGGVGEAAPTLTGEPSKGNAVAEVAPLEQPARAVGETASPSVPGEKGAASSQSGDAAPGTEKATKIPLRVAETKSEPAPEEKTPLPIEHSGPDAEIARLRREHAEALAVPLASEGGISPAQIGRMSPREHAKWQALAQEKMAVEAQIRDLRRSPEQIEESSRAEERRQITGRLAALDRRIEDLSRVGVGKSGKIRPTYQAEIGKATSERETLTARMAEISPKQLPIKHVPRSSDALSLLKANPLDILGLTGGKFGGGKVKGTLPNPEDGFYPSDETKWQALQRKVADRFVKLRDTEKEAPGKGSDFSGAETRMHGRAAHAQNLLERAQERATKILREEGVSAERIGQIASARHAPTRNRIIAERTEGANLEGSGMSDERAFKIMESATPAELRALKVHDEVRDKALDFAVESGLVSAEEAAAWREKFGDTFTSLKTIGDEEATAMPGVGKSLQVRGKEAKRAEGRSSEATNPFVSVFQNAQDIILRGEKNLVAQEFGELVRNNPGKWAEFEKPDGNRAPSGEDVFTYKENGEPVYIRVRDASTLKALKNLDPVAAGTLLRMAAKAGRVMSGLATSRNPDFVASNLARDLQTAVGNVSAEESVKRAAQIFKDVGPSLKEMHAAARRPEEATGYAKEYLEHGALTDWIEPTTPQKRLANMEKRLTETPVREKLRALAEAVSDISESVENGTRFAYFKALRKAGISADEAAVRSKELTVNWSKKGEWSATMNALYLFSSANANGTVRFAQAWVKKPARAAAYAGTLTAAGYLMAMLNDNAGGEDEKDGRKWWDKQNDANKRRYAMVQHQNGSTTRLPLAPGWGWFWYLGGKLYDGQKNGKIDTGDIVGSAADQLSPVGSLTDQSLGQIVSPWFLDPFVSVSENKDYAGRPIFTDRSEHDKRPYASLPGEQRATETAKAISKLANDLTGGDEARQGSFDVPPFGLDYLAAESGSGLGRFMQRVGKTVTQSLHGEMPMWRDMPIISRFKGDAPKTYSRDFYAIVDQIEAENTAQKGGQKFDANVLAYRVAAAHAQATIDKLRAAGLDDAAEKAQADFIKAFDARKKR